MIALRKKKGWSVEDLARIIGEPHKLVRQPRDGLRFARTGRMLDQHPPSRPFCLGIGKKLAHHIELMKAREELVSL